MYMYVKIIYESGTLLLPLKLLETWEPSWEFPPSFLWTSSIDILRNRAQVCVKYLPIAKKLAFHIEFINRQASGHKPAQHFSLSSEEFAWKLSCTTRGWFSPIPYSLQQQRQPGVLQCPLWKEKLLRQLALEQAHSTSAHPISHLPQTCFNAWHLGLHGLPFESYTPEWHSLVDRIWQVRDWSGRFFPQPVAHNVLFSLVLKLLICFFLR